MRSENKNFLLNVVYQGLTLVFPLVTVPYISRVLGVDNVGIYSYTYSIAYMFMLGGMLGINNYGTRSIARVPVSNVTPFPAKTRGGLESSGSESVI